MHVTSIFYLIRKLKYIFLNVKVISDEYLFKNKLRKFKHHAKSVNLKQTSKIGKLICCLYVSVFSILFNEVSVKTEIMHKCDGVKI